MKTELLCDNCKRSFQGEEWLMDKPGEVLCPDCYEELKSNQH